MDDSQHKGVISKRKSSCVKLHGVCEEILLLHLTTTKGDGEMGRNARGLAYCLHDGRDEWNPHFFAAVTSRRLVLIPKTGGFWTKQVRTRHKITFQPPNRSTAHPRTLTPTGGRQRSYNVKGRSDLATGR